MRAAEHERVDVRRASGVEVLLRDETRRRVVGPPLLDERHEQRARRARRTCACGASARIARSYAPEFDRARRCRSRRSRRPSTRRTAARAPGSTTPTTGTGSSARSVGSACAVAVLHATTTAFTPCSEQERGDLAAVAAHRLRALRTVRHARRVAEVEDRLVGQLAHELARDGQPADARVEDADRARGAVGAGAHHASTRNGERRATTRRAHGDLRRAGPTGSRTTNASAPAKRWLNAMTREPVLEMQASRADQGGRELIRGSAPPVAGIGLPAVSTGKLGASVLSPRNAFASAQVERATSRPSRARLLRRRRRAHRSWSGRGATARAPAASSE